MAAFLDYTSRVVYVDDDNVAVITRDKVTITDLDGAPIDKGWSQVDWDAGMAERGGFEHFMLKEIHDSRGAA